MTLWNENPPTLRKRREWKKINNFYVWQKHACLKSILAMCQKKFSTFFSFSSEGENFFLSYFLIFSIIIYFYAFFLSFPPSHEKWMGKENKFFSAAAFVSFLSFLHTRVDDEISMLVLEKKLCEGKKLFKNIHMRRIKAHISLKSFFKIN